MKVIVNKEAALSRVNSISSRVIKKAVDAANEGKVDFYIELGIDEMNGIGIDEIVKMVEFKSEGTIAALMKYKPGDTTLYFKIIEESNVEF